MKRTHLAQAVPDAAGRDPSHPAVTMEGRTLSYAELDALSNRVARSLRARGVERGDRVALWLPKTPAAIATLYGILKCGAAYVPVDPGSPPARLSSIARDAGVRALVTAADRLGAAREALAGLASLRGTWIADGATAGDAGGDVVPWAEVEAEDDAAPVEAPGPGDLAYILYTSGSTGVPKGVVHTHASALAFVEWAAATFELRAADRVSHHAPFHFDLSTFELYATAIAGATVFPVSTRTAMFPAALATLYTGERLTVWYETPSALTLLLRHGRLAERDLSALRVLLFAGEVMPPALLRELMTLAPAARFANLYGPTETNVCTWHEVITPPAGDEPLPIGIECAGDETCVLDESLRPVPEGEPGELWVSGPTVMQGYWGDPERTARTLRDLEWAGGTRRAYRTGDIVRRRNDGAFDFRGRRDHQVKTRGYRVELGEVESALHGHAEVAEAVIVPVPDPEVGHRLHAVVVRKPGGTATAATLRDHCARLLPRYMVPEAVEFRELLPRSASGKVDRTALTTEITRG